MTLIRPRLVPRRRCLKRLLIILCLSLLSPQMRAGADDAMTPIFAGYENEMRHQEGTNRAHGTRD